jgi:hypothetical protein
MDIGAGCGNAPTMDSEQQGKATTTITGLVLMAVLAVAGGCSDHHPDLWFDAGSDAKTGDVEASVDAYWTGAGDTNAADSTVGDGLVAADAAADVPMTLDKAGDLAADASQVADTSTDDAHRGDLL